MKKNKKSTEKTNHLSQTSKSLPNHVKIKFYYLVHAIESKRKSMSRRGSMSSDNIPMKEESVNMMFPNESMVGATGVPMG